MEELVKFISESSKNHISEEDTLKGITILNNLSKKAYKPLKGKILLSLNQGMSISGTIWLRVLTACGCTIQSTQSITIESTMRLENISIREHWCLPPES